MKENSCLAATGDISLTVDCCQRIMADEKQRKEVCNVLFLCLAWYVVSSTNNVIGKTVLNQFPYPITMTMVQLLTITVLSGPLFNLWGIRKYVDISWKYYCKLIIPLALGKFIASVLSHVSIWKVPVSYAHTGKGFECFIYHMFTLLSLGFVDFFLEIKTFV